MKRTAIPGLGLSLLLVACGGGGDGEPDAGDGHVHDGGQVHDGAHPAPDDASADAADTGEAAEYVGCPDTFPTFALGLEATGDGAGGTAVLRKASPSPPERFLNDWVVQMVDGQGEPTEEIEVLGARAFMRVHGHYGQPDPTVTRHDDDPSMFDLDALNLFMRGPWEIQLMLDTPDGERMVTFEVCVNE